ncbi:MAG: hypothetical protein C5B51_02155 [Terriglobia bacterium]|nr:MAG: hypothetical protein C5B51_02155 [Terriglobia bacterium]
MNRLPGLLLLASLLSHFATAQVIEFESHGLRYQTLTRSGVTVMFAALPSHVREYTILQVAISNGSAGPYVIKPEDFYYLRNGGAMIQASAARTVIADLIEKASRNDVTKLVNTYEAALYGIPHMKSTNGYEQRRQAAIAGITTKLRAAATASAVALVPTKLVPGETTDGAIFLPTEGKPLGPGHLQVRTNTDVFDFNTE